MGDRAPWVKVWHSSITDQHLDNLDIGDFGRWCKLLAHTKLHGTAGTVTIEYPARAVISMFQVANFKELEDAIRRLPGVIIKRESVTDDVTDAGATLIVTFKNWHKYQVDSSVERVRRWRRKQAKCNGSSNGVGNDGGRTPALQRNTLEEMRRDEKRTTSRAAGAATRERGEAKPRKPTQDGKYPVPEFFDLYFAAYEKRYGEKPPISEEDRRSERGKMAGIARTILQRMPLQRIPKLLDLFFTSDDPFFNNAGHSVEAFLGCLNRLIAMEKGVAVSRDDQDYQRKLRRAYGMED